MRMPSFGLKVIIEAITNQKHHNHGHMYVRVTYDFGMLYVTNIGSLYLNNTSFRSELNAEHFDERYIPLLLIFF